MKLAITGTTASGKTTVCQILKKYINAQVISADEIVHELLSSNTPIIQQVIALFGSEILTDHHIDRKKLSQIVFADKKKLTELEKILHPAVEKEILRYAQLLHRQKPFPVLIVEVPLLYESKMEHLFDKVIVVVSDEAHAANRFSLGPEEYLRRASRQIPQEEKMQKGDYIIVNNGDLSQLENEIKKIIPLIKQSHD